jgi:hypothetical protein
MEQLFGPNSRPPQSLEGSPGAKALHEDFLREKKRREKKREELSDEQLRQIRQDQEKALIERRNQWDAEVKRVQERFDKEMEARYGPSKGNKS